MLFSLFRRKSRQTNRTEARRTSAVRKARFESLEDRRVLSTYHVVNLNDSGMGSLRWAIEQANSHAGTDDIEFDVAGTISLTSGALPTITGKTKINGRTAPGYSGIPEVLVDFNNFGGLKFSSNADGSRLKSLALVDAADNGVTLTGVSGMKILGNFIGVGLDGDTVVANRGNGIELHNSHDNIIGGTDADDCNVVSGNNKSGIRLNNSRRNDILGNCIGTDLTGETARGNVGSGIVITAGSYKNTIGGEAGNVISGNFGNGVLLNGKSKLNTVASNWIGTDMFGEDAIGNHGDGIKLQTTERNLVGREDIVTGIDYYNSADGTAITTNVQGWQGLRAASASGNYLVVGTSGSSGVLFDGTINGNTGTTYYPVDFPGATETTVYGPALLDGGVIRLVGTYQSNDDPSIFVNGFLFEGTTADLGNASHYRTINYPGAQYTYVHSTAGGLAVGNYTSEDAEGNKLPGKAFIYDIANDTFLPNVVFPGSKQNSAYGIWWNGDSKYTIAGGYSNGLAAVANGQPLGHGLLVDFNSATQEFKNWKSFAYPDDATIVTHFQGISSVEAGYFTLAANSAVASTSDPVPGSWVVVYRNSDGTFSDGQWSNLAFQGATGLTTGDSVYGNQIVGIVIGEGISYQATINVGFQLSNIISGNSGNGIGLYGAKGNQVAMNYIGTDVTGTLALGNGKNGILITEGASNNLIGGVASGGNDPTEGVFVRPPQGNLISANLENGVLITGKATNNQLSGNYIGTDETGNSALGNEKDGVAIVGADYNSLIGCNFEQNPFVYYNVISGNLGNGLRVKNSDHTVIQANFFGMGADNNTNVGNFLNGVLVEGDSAYTTMGGPIPLGNVSACNGQNGIYVRNSASYFISYNTFAGLAAFSSITTFGNGKDGIKITSTGGNNYLRTNVVSNNLDDGIDISGNASDVRVTGNIVGMNSYGFTGMGNADNGIEIRGSAHNIVIGGPQPTFNVIPQNTISDNGGNGVAVLEQANNIILNCSFIGLDVNGEQAFGNAENGVYLGSGTHSVTIGSAETVKFRTVISSNGQNGIEMDGTRNNTVFGTRIGTDLTGLSDFGNGGNGILITNSSNNLIGSKNKNNPGNIIAFNDANGVHVQSGDGNTIRRNSVFDNALLGIDLSPGANNNQAAPVLLGAGVLSTDVPLGVEVVGTLTSTANSTFTVEFFANFVSGPSGRFLLGSMKVTTNASGVAEFEFIGKLPPPGAGFLTATATDAKGNTSEFSNDVVIEDWPSFTPGIYLLDPSQMPR